MTELLYQTDSYLRDFSAEVIGSDAEQHGVFLDRTAFYPGGGGQPHDDGHFLIDGIEIPVIKTKRVKGQVVHYFPEDMPLLQTGTRLTGVLNWEKRYALMRTHTALHILCGVVFRDYGAQVTGGDMDPLNGRMDFEFETMQKELVADIERAINLEVQENRTIRVEILPREEAFQIPDLIRTKINLLPQGITEVRVVEIEGLDLQADGGTHVHATGEVGSINVVDYKSKGKINKRIYIQLT
jgi:misacylated tRNA(Ala) deacylase